MMYWNGHMTAAGWVVAILWTVIILALIAGAIYWLVSALAGRTTGAPGRTTTEASAREILDQRLAKGEISIEQYKELRETIGDEASPSGAQPLPSSRPASTPG